MRALRRQPPPPTLQSTYVPAPTGGLNTLAPGAAMPEGDCPKLVNMVSAENGLRVRLGYQQTSNLFGGLGRTELTIRTFLPYSGSAADGSKDRLFAVNPAGIFDVSSVAATTNEKRLFNITTGKAGYGICHACTTSAGHFLLYCDEENGYFIYTESTDSWAPINQGSPGTPGTINNVDPLTLCFVTVWKSRVWFVEKNSARAWYLAAGAITGDATQLNLDRAAQFRAGGGLRGLWGWTLDGGIGIDDHLVAIGDGGDVAVYRGTDPASADTFALRGTWNAGGLVSGRSIATNFGGDILLLTKSGIRPLSQLTSGNDGQGTYQTAKVANLFNKLTLERSELPGWAIHIHPEENALMVLVPTYQGAPTEQLTQSLWNRSWSRYASLPIVAAAVWKGKLYFSTISDGTPGVGAKVWVNSGSVDNRPLAGAQPSTTYDPIQWSLLTPFRNQDAHQKKVELIRATLESDEVNPSCAAEARYNYDLTPMSTQTVGSASGSGFDVSTWDGGTWVDDYAPSKPLLGATGIGSDVAIAVAGAAASRTILVGLEVFLKEGGYL